MTTDPFAAFKIAQQEGWSHFGPVEVFTTPPAATLVKFARIKSGQAVLDVACGTGVVAVTAARAGAKVQGLDLTPQLLERARQNAALANQSIEFVQGDVEALPYPDASFDVVVSQFGHMFAPRPDVAVAQMLRVLKPGGCIAFSTWPPELFIGRMFQMVSRHIQPPEGVQPPPLWGDPNVVRQRLGDAVTDLTFARDVLNNPVLSPQHARVFFETVGPLAKAAKLLDAQKLAALRGDLEAIIAEHVVDNILPQHYLMSRALKRR